MIIFKYNDVLQTRQCDTEDKCIGSFIDSEECSINARTLCMNGRGRRKRMITINKKKLKNLRRLSIGKFDVVELYTSQHIYIKIINIMNML